MDLASPALDDGTETVLLHSADLPGDESTDEESSEHEPDRPNRYRGPASTWRSWTESERLLAASLDQLRAGDLSLHLYCAHSLKARHRDEESVEGAPAWASKDRWRSAEDAFVPPKGWTAWPMRPELVPRDGERRGEEWESWTLKKRENFRPSRKLEDSVTGEVLKAARGRFEAREEEEEDVGRQLLKASRSRSGGKRSSRSRSRPNSSTFTEVEAVKVSQKPVVMADEQKASEILRPIVRHVLSKIDNLLEGLHHARRACVTSSPDDTTTETQTAVSNPASRASSVPSQKPKRPRGRPRKILEPISIPAIAPDEGDDELSDSVPAATKKMGRPRKYRKPVEGESHYFMRRRTRELENPLTAEAPNAAPFPISDPAFPGPKKRRRSSPATRARSAHDRRARLGLRDWSDVLGTACLTGWPDGAVQRAAARCAVLFGEGMGFRTFSDSGGAEEVVYGAASHPPPRSSGSGSSAAESSASASERADDAAHTPSRANSPSPTKRKRSGGAPEAEPGPASDEEVSHGAHVDGFLREIKARDGWGGRGWKKKQKKEPRARTGEAKVEPKRREGDVT
ncbi:MAG: hypothetical protein M1832_000821 [Thelocarpon impressellum]|nr:MAG: hypothetical protein M1832_000821 [Thelocarpon impressellum]